VAAALWPEPAARLCSSVEEAPIASVDSATNEPTAAKSRCSSCRSPTSTTTCDEQVNQAASASG